MNKNEFESLKINFGTHSTYCNEKFNSIHMTRLCQPELCAEVLICS